MLALIKSVQTSLLDVCIYVFQFVRVPLRIIPRYSEIALTVKLLPVFRNYTQWFTQNAFVSFFPLLTASPGKEWC